ncbi:MAG: hypothetical protein HY880_00955, partial [Deltaproteobacteria bacterium]|nr:hypothetical protein [Deltaproteobacteria bacterium]
MEGLKRRVVVTGMGVVSPIGIGNPAFWESVSKGVSGVSLIEGFDTTPYRTRIAAQIKGFDPLEYLSPQKVYATDRHTQFALVATTSAVKDSGLMITEENKKNIGVIWGSSEGGIHTREEGYEMFFLKGPRAGDPMIMMKAMGVAPAANISIEFGVRGFNYCFTNTCSTGAITIGEGARLIRHGYIDAVI